MSSGTVNSLSVSDALFGLTFFLELLKMFRAAVMEYQMGDAVCRNSISYSSGCWEK